MKSGDKRRVSTLRLVNAAIKDRDIQNRTAGPDAGVSDAQIVEVLRQDGEAAPGERRDLRAGRPP